MTKQYTIPMMLFSAMIGSIFSIVMYQSDGVSGAAVGALVGLIIWRFPAIIDQKLKGQSFLQALIAKMIIFDLLIFCALNVGIFVGGDTETETYFSLTNVTRYWTLSQWYFDVVFILGIAAVVSFFISVNALIGAGVFWQFLFGRYHHPLKEERIFMFLDLANSTGTAERLGELKFHSLLQDLVVDASDIIAHYHGQIDRYLGDCIVVTWTLKEGTRNQACLKCFYDIRDRLEERSIHYKAEYQITPHFRAGFHAGSVVAGEIGVQKKEIVFLGDTVNTASRVENACVEHNCDLLITRELKEALDLGVNWTVRNLGSFLPRGRAQATELFNVSPNVSQADPLKI